MAAKAPRATDYLEALQFPAECFADEELAAGEPALTPLGLPKVTSGNVACVFKVDAPTGRTYAVRCFVRQFDDMAVRYAAVAARLSKTTASWKVGVDFQPRGVHVGGEWYPIVKMDWSEATPLLPWIEAHLWDTAAMSYLAARFVELVAGLRAAGIAHGDLQHGNILVAPGGDLRLVDYDGMYVPELARLPLRSNELGHRNYAHPGRTRDDFGLHLDAFPSWVVYASLAALSIDPLPWGRLDGGDECLLFRAADFADPERSDALAAFESSGDERLRALATAVRRQVARPVAEVEPLSPGVVPAPALELPAASNAVSVDDLRERQSLMDVLRAAAAPLTVEEPAAADPSMTEARWTVPKPDAEVAAAFGPEMRRHRMGLTVVLGVLAVLPLLGLGGLLPVGVALGAVFVGLGVAAFLVTRQFHDLPAVQASLPQQQVLASRRSAAVAAAERVEALTAARRAVDADEQRAAEQFTGLEADFRHREQVQLQAVEDGLRRTLSDLAAKEHDLYRAEQREQAERLRTLQDEVLAGELRKHRLVKAGLPGVDDKVVYGLALDDVRTAADVAEVVVDNGVFVVHPDGRRVRAGALTADDARMLMGWRRRLEGQYQYLLPTALPAHEVASIRQSYAAQRIALEHEGRDARAGAARQGEEVRASLRAERERRAAELLAAKQAAAARRLELDRDLARARKDAAEAQFHLAAAERDAGDARHLTPAAYVRLLVGR
ncbi:MAG TPA: hypothetical protein VGB03_03345 [Acidimicrobiales bacterium]